MFLAISSPLCHYLASSRGMCKETLFITPILPATWVLQCWIAA